MAIVQGVECCCQNAARPGTGRHSFEGGRLNANHAAHEASLDNLVTQISGKLEPG